MKLDLAARLSFDSVQFDKNNDAHLVVTLKAPKLDWQSKRPRVCIIPVIDISPSMDGEKIMYAKQSVMKLIDHLQPGDFCGIVAFGGEVFTVSKPVEVTQFHKDDLKAKVGALTSNGSTNFSGGMCQGLELINKGDLPEDMLKRVIMFTDGMPNTGIAITRPDIVRLLEANLGKATLSAFGYGSDADQELLADVAKAGKGNYAFVRNPEDALSAFAKELGGLLSTFAQNIVIEVAPHNGHTITEVVSDVDATPDGNKMLVKLSDILSEEERHVVFKVLLDAQPNAFPRESSVFDVKVEFDQLDGAQQKIHQTVELKTKVKFVKADEAQQKPTPEVDRIVGLAQLVAEQIKAEELVKAGNYRGASVLMGNMADLFKSRGLDDLADVGAKVSHRVGDAVLYAQSTGYLAYGTSSLDAEASVDLSGMGLVMSNSAQGQTQASFGAPGSTSAAPVAPPAPVVHFQPPVQPAPAPNINVKVKVGGRVLKPLIKPSPVPPPAPKHRGKQRSKRW
jgi:Ca-activated chloride channel homolog